MARGAAVAGGILGTGLAIVAASIQTALQVFYTLLTVSLFVPVLAGLYSRRVASPEAIGAIAAGVGLFLVVRLGTAGGGLAGLTPAMIGLAGAAAACGIVATVRSALAGGATS